MNEAFVIERDFLFKENIFEITSISIEHDYDINGEKLEGDFIISGDYKVHEVSINKEDFSFKVPFTHELRSNINLDTINLEITDFSYELQNGDELHVHIEYIITAEQGLIEFADETSLDEFLKTNDAEVVDLSEESPRFKDIQETTKMEFPQITDKTTAPVESLEEETPEPSEALTNQTTILNSINSEETYIKYHVHTVMPNDTLEGILNKYKINLLELKKYNSFETLEINMKLIIPEYEEN